MIKILRLSLLIILLSSSKLFSQHLENETSFNFGISVNNFRFVQDNLGAAVYSFAFDDFQDRNVFDLKKPMVSIGLEFGLQIPLNERFMYKIRISRVHANAGISYTNKTATDVSRELKFRQTAFDLLNFSYLFSKRHSFGIGIPLIAGKLLHKAEGIEGIEDKFKVLSTKQLISHYLNMDLVVFYQFCITKNLAINFSLNSSLFGGDEVFSQTSMYYINANYYSMTTLFKF